jgi:GMP synthase PP-ATPase subunit
MTADWIRLHDDDVLERATNEIRGATSKPPGTIEWE